jgi:hypothetical protein
MKSCRYPLVALVAIVPMMLFLFSSVQAKDWEIEPDSVELTDGDIDRPYEIRELISFKLKRDTAEESAKEAREELKKIAADRKCDAVIFVDHFIERDPTELFTNALVVQSLDSAEIAKRNKKYKSPDEIREKVKAKEIILATKDIPYPYKVLWIADVISPDGAAATMTTVDSQLSDMARKKRGHAVIFIEYDRMGTQVDGAKGIIVKFPRGWLKTGELD